MQYVSQIEPLRNSAAVKVNTREVNYVHGRRRTREKGEARKAKLTKRHTFLSISAGRAWNRLGLGPTILSGRVESGQNATAILKTFLFPSEPFSRTFRSLINPDLLSLLLRLLCNWKTFSIFYFPAPLMPQLFRFCRALAAHTFSFRQTFSNKYFSQFISQSLFAVWQNAFFFSCLFRAGKFFVCVISHRLAPRHVEHCRGQRNFPGSSRSWKQRTEKQKISFFFRIILVWMVKVNVDGRVVSMRPSDTVSMRPSRSGVQLNRRSSHELKFVAVISLQRVFG